MSEWQPIETAPIEPFNPARWYSAHSPRLLLWNGGYSVIGNYGFTERGKGRWLDHASRVCEPTHWMPLPPPPEQQS